LIEYENTEANYGIFSITYEAKHSTASTQTPTIMAATTEAATTAAATTAWQRVASLKNTKHTEHTIWLGDTAETIGRGMGIHAQRASFRCTIPIVSVQIEDGGQGAATLGV
jgi:hypothetical protein